MPKIIKSITILMLIVSTKFAMADNRFYFIGGGDEPVKSVDGTEYPSTSFDGSLEKMAIFPKNKNYTPYVLFDGGHAKSDELKKALYPQAPVVNDFNRTNFRELFIAQLIQDIESKKVKPGEKVVIHINTHGDQNRYKDLPGHVLTGADGINTSELQQVIDIAEKSGIRLAIIDQSCFSGATLKLKTTSTCILSASTEDRISIANNPFENDSNSSLKGKVSFGHLLQEQMTSNQQLNLEEIYYRSITESAGAEFPGMNNNESMQIINMLNNYISQYLDFNATGHNDGTGKKISDTTLDKIDLLLERVNTTEALCQFEQSFQENILKMEAEIRARVGSLEVFLPLKKALEDYHKTLINHISANILLNKNEQNFVIPSKYKGFMTLREILLYDPKAVRIEKKAGMEKELAASKTEKQRDQIRHDWAPFFEQADQVEKIREELLRTNPEIKKTYDDLQYWKAESDRIIEKAFIVGTEARKVYGKLYDANRPKKDACREFIP